MADTEYVHGKTLITTNSWSVSGTKANIQSGWEVDETILRPIAGWRKRAGKVSFTDKKKYVQGVGSAIMTDISTGDVLFYSDKFQEANVSFSTDDGFVNAGIGNGPVVSIPTNPDIQVNVTAADYSAYAKRVSAGGKLIRGSSVLTCQAVTGTNHKLTIDLSEGTPVTPVGGKSVICYVQELGEKSSVTEGGTAYTINPSTGAVNGFTAANGTEYLVTYYVAQANTNCTVYTGNFTGKTVRFVLRRPIYINVKNGGKTGTVWGWLYEIIPRLQLTAGGAANSGNETGITATNITGRAISANDSTISKWSRNCVSIKKPLMYRVIVPCDLTEGLTGIIGAVGGTLVLARQEVVRLSPVAVVNGSLVYNIPANNFRYVSSNVGVVTVGTRNGIVMAMAPGTATITVSYTAGGHIFTDDVAVTVTSGA